MESISARRRKSTLASQQTPLVTSSSIWRRFWRSATRTNWVFGPKSIPTKPKTSQFKVRTRMRTSLSQTRTTLTNWSAAIPVQFWRFLILARICSKVPNRRNGPSLWTCLSQCRIFTRKFLRWLTLGEIRLILIISDFFFSSSSEYSFEKSWKESFQLFELFEIKRLLAKI